LPPYLSGGSMNKQILGTISDGADVKSIVGNFFVIKRNRSNVQRGVTKDSIQLVTLFIRYTGWKMELLFISHSGM
jgi:hypothetical protein